MACQIIAAFMAVPIGTSYKRDPARSGQQNSRMKGHAPYIFRSPCWLVDCKLAGTCIVSNHSGDLWDSFYCRLCRHPGTQPRASVAICLLPGLCTRCLRHNQALSGILQFVPMFCYIYPPFPIFLLDCHSPGIAAVPCMWFYIMHCLFTLSPFLHGGSITIAWILRPKNARRAEDPLPRYLVVLISDTCGHVRSPDGQSTWWTPTLVPSDWATVV